ncbi:hypothetical protein [Nocardiopsis sp. LOL_012]|uniref:hypothetical protein n=1 Tax=Nocardiopsis sp. LOL_012 TaxID=3345409 RepID=UPI003A85A3E2
MRVHEMHDRYADDETPAALTVGDLREYIEGLDDDQVVVDGMNGHHLVNFDRSLFARCLELYFEDLPGR